MFLLKNHKKIRLLCLITLFPILIKAQQSLSGSFPKLASQHLYLFGYEGFNTFVVDSTVVDENGFFQLNFGAKDFGMAFLSIKDKESFAVILSANEHIKLKGESLANTLSIEILSGKQTQFFAQYATEHPRREQTLSIWSYLQKIYKGDSLFALQEAPKQAMLHEMQRINTEDSLFLAELDPDSYVSYYLPLRKLVSSVSTLAQYRTEEIPAAIASFRKIDYNDPRLQKSGLLADVIESHFWLIENSGRSLDLVDIEMKRSIDILVENLSSHEQKLNEITEYLFKLLEKRSLFNASEYLAIKLLNENTCTINKNFGAQLECYRAMKKGKIAPDFDFKKEILAPSYEVTNLPKKLSDLKSNYTVVVFGASWCPLCPQELSKISGLYNKWKKQRVEVVFVSLDEDEKLFKSFASVFPFISICDYQKWESPIMKSYHVFATPILYLLDNKRKILLRPNSVSQLDSWVDWYLVQGNKQ